MSAIFYSVGTGPGDPKLLTLAAIEAIQNADVIALPDSGAGENAVGMITKEYLSGKELLNLSMPMIRDQRKLARIHEENADSIAKLLDGGKSVAALTIGDPTIYSTAGYLHDILRERGYQTKIIPGVPSFCAVAATLGTSLCEGSEPLHIIPASYSDTLGALSLSGTKILMKAGAAIGELAQALAGKNAQAVERCGMENEKIHYTLENISDAGYFCVVVVKEDKQ